MADARSQRLTRNRKKTSVPLSNLRTAEVVRAVVDHPRRLAELINLLEDKNRSVRGRAAATLARLSETHAGRLLRIVDRLKEGMCDDSAYVRWSLGYALGNIGSYFPNQIARVFPELAARMDDENRVVRVVVFRAIRRLAARRSQVVKNLFDANKRDIPESIARAIKDAETPRLRAEKHS